MKKAIYCVLLLCGILLQCVCNSSAENNEKSEESHIRQKRVAGGERHNNRNDAPYLLTIIVRGDYKGPATLITADVAITSAHRVYNKVVSQMAIESRVQNDAILHPIVSVNMLDPHYNDSRLTFKNLALLKFRPPLNFQISYNRPIRIHSGSVAEEERIFHLLNWGKPFLASSGRLVTLNFRSIPVNLVSVQYCQEFYPNGLVGVGNICTSPRNHGQHGTTEDSGAPLTVDGNLLGIMVFRGYGRSAVLDVHMNLLDNGIRRWIHQHVPSLRLLSS